jgi:hypothetical protein
MNFWNYKRKQKIQISGAQCWTALWPGFRPSAWPSGLAGMTNTVRSSRARWQTRCSEGGGASTVGAVATSLIRLWRWVDGEGGGEGSFGGGTPAMGSSSGGGSDILEHREVNRGG